MQLWLVGQWAEPQWHFQGVFDSKEKALAACVTDSFFAAPVTMNQSYPVGTVSFEGAWYPAMQPEPQPVQEA
jgi:hypothetical protein